MAPPTSSPTGEIGLAKSRLVQSQAEPPPAPRGSNVSTGQHGKSPSSHSCPRTGWVPGSGRVDSRAQSRLGHQPPCPAPSCVTAGLSTEHFPHTTWLYVAVGFIFTTALHPGPLLSSHR